jgi:hypothetical protein
MSLTHWKTLKDQKFLGSHDLAIDDETYGEVTVTITKVTSEMVKNRDGKDGKCTIVYTAETKPFIANNENCDMITSLFKSSFVEKWIGQKITLHVKKIKAFGAWTQALRVKNVLHAPIALEALTPDHKRWDGAVTALKSGKTTLEQIKAKFLLSAENEALLIQSTKPDAE